MLAPSNPDEVLRADRPVGLKDRSKVRLLLAMAAFSLVYILIAGRLMHLAMTPDQPSIAYRTAQDAISAARPDIIDRQGRILATDLKTYSPLCRTPPDS